MATKPKKDPTPELNQISMTTSSTLPRSVRILGKEVIITQTKPADTDDDDFGSWNDNNLLIYVKPGQLPIEEIDTLLHETIHGIDFVMDLGLTEHQVRLLGTALAGIFQDNLEFASFVTRKVGRPIK